MRWTFSSEIVTALDFFSKKSFEFIITISSFILFFFKITKAAATDAYGIIIFIGNSIIASIKLSSTSFCLIPPVLPELNKAPIGTSTAAIPSSFNVARACLIKRYLESLVGSYKQLSDGIFIIYSLLYVPPKGGSQMILSYFSTCSIGLYKESAHLTSPILLPLRIVITAAIPIVETLISWAKTFPLPFANEFTKIPVPQHASYTDISSSTSISALTILGNASDVEYSPLTLPPTKTILSNNLFATL